MKISIVATILLASVAVLGGIAHAERTYTPSQLKAMIKAGKYPDQGEPETVIYVTDFESCKVRVLMIFAPVKDEYPVLTIVQTKAMLVRKVWTNESAVTVTCSAKDEKMVIATAPYL